MSGWIKLHRSILDFEWYEDANTMRTFLHLLLSANHKPRKWKGTVVERGQVITSRDHLATDLKLSVQQIRTALSKLEKSENITIKSTKRFTAITVCNYGTYQSEEVDSNQQSNPPVTNNQPTDNQQVTTNKNVRIKECKNERNKEKGSLSQKSEKQLRIEKLFNRRPSTPYDKSETSAWRSAKAVVEELTDFEWTKLEAFYAAPQRETYRRKSLATLLNNLSGEVENALQWKPKNTTNRTAIGAAPIS